MLVIITGGTGFIGQALAVELLEAGHKVTIVSRSRDKVPEEFRNDTCRESWQDLPCLMGPDTAVVNLAGESIAGRWTSEKKERILNSRLRAGKAVVWAIEQAEQKPSVLIQASAVGYYGPSQGEDQPESAPCGKGFLADVACQWEESTAEVEAMGVRRCLIRTGMVVGEGGALDRMLPFYRWFMGGPPGSGSQPVSWIHLKDEVGAIRFLIENAQTSGPYNLATPEPTDFRTFSRELGKAMSRPGFMPTPGFVLRLLFGEMADEVLLSGQRAIPERLLKAGYAFRYPELAQALVATISQMRG